MPQTMKPAVRRRILEAARDELVAVGFLSATVGAIARRAGVSTGNVYRYFENKGALFEAVVDDAFVAELDRLLDARVAALTRLPDVRSLDVPAAERQTELLDFWIAHRERVVIALDRCEGTRHGAFGARFVDRLVAHTLAHLQSRASRPLPDHTAFVLRSLFDGTRRTIVAILEHHAAPDDVRAAFATFWSFQLAGLAGLEQEVLR
ncbi:MAG: helix-turn-helix domain-containing protein [Myxococcota bacterium]